MLKVVETGSPDRQASRSLPRRLLDGQYLPHCLSCQGIGQKQLRIAARKYNFSSVLSGPRSHVNHMVGNGNHILVMLHHQNRVAFVPELPQQIVHPVNVPGMHSGTWFIKDIGQAGQAAAHVPDQLQALGFAAGKGGRFTVQVKVGKAYFNQPVQTFDDGLHQDVHPLVGNPSQNFPKSGQLHAA